MRRPSKPPPFAIGTDVCATSQKHQTFEIKLQVSKCLTLFLATTRYQQNMFYEIRYHTSICEAVQAGITYLHSVLLCAVFFSCLANQLNEPSTFRLFMKYIKKKNPLGINSVLILSNRYQSDINIRFSYPAVTI